MRKFIVMLLALAVLLSLTGTAFAEVPPWMKFFKDGGASIQGDIKAKVEIDNKAKAFSGYANAAGNASVTDVFGTSQSKSLGDTCPDSKCPGSADNETYRVVSNTGEAGALTSDAAALNTPNNWIDTSIQDVAAASAECNVFGGNGCPNETALGIVSGNPLSDCGECCPAESQGDIKAKVDIDNKAIAISGDANAAGNASATFIATDSLAFSAGGGNASNYDETTVINDGTANAMSGAATSTNNVNNNINIDILRSVTSEKCCQFLGDFLNS